MVAITLLNVWRPRPRVRTLLGASLLVIVFVAAGLVASVDRRYTLETGHRIAETRGHILEEQTAHSFHAVDLTLLGIVDAIRVAPSLGDHDAVFEETLRRRRDALPHVRALFVIGADGFITQDTDHPYTPHVTLADRPYFEVHARNLQVGLHIGHPVISRSVGRRFVSMSRRIERRGGSFAGIAVAAVEPGYFGNFYDSLRLSDHGNISLFLLDGTLLARNPHDESVIGRSFAGYPLFKEKVAVAAAGTYETSSPVDGVRRIIGYRRVTGFPLIVMVGLDRDALLAPWRLRALWSFAAIVVISMLAGFLRLVVARHARQRAEVRQRLAEGERLEALGRLAGSIAHDFGNVLSTVVLSLHAAQRIAKDDEVSGALERALRVANRGTQVASQLLGFARRQELTLETVSVNKVLSGLEDLLRDAASTAADLNLDLAADVWSCRMDKSQFGIALLNLVINARQALPGRRGHIRVATVNVHGKDVRATDRPARQYVRVTVQDDGIGMPPEVVRRVTDPFYTTKTDGTGLGVSQVYGFVKQVGGDLRIESIVGAGTSVHLLFPRVVTQSPPDH
jgi:two-component system, NtrC family, sensor kinase